MTNTNFCRKASTDNHSENRALDAPSTSVSCEFFPLFRTRSKRGFHSVENLRHMRRISSKRSALVSHEDFNANIKSQISLLSDSLSDVRDNYRDMKKIFMDKQETPEKHSAFERELQSPRLFELLQLSKRGGNRNQDVTCLSKGKFRGKTKDIAEEMLKGSLNLQESMVVLGRSSKCNSKLSNKKNSITEIGCKEYVNTEKTRSNLLTGNIFNHKSQQKTQVYIESSKNQVQHLRNIALESFPNGNASMVERLLSDVSCSLGVTHRDYSNRGHKTFDCNEVKKMKELHSRRITCKREKPPTLTANLMGLERLPLEASKKIRNKQLSKKARLLMCGIKAEINHPPVIKGKIRETVKRKYLSCTNQNIKNKEFEPYFSYTSRLRQRESFSTGNYLSNDERMPDEVIKHLHTPRLMNTVREETRLIDNGCWWYKHKQGRKYLMKKMNKYVSVRDEYSNKKKESEKENSESAAVLELPENPKSETYERLSETRNLISTLYYPNLLELPGIEGDININFQTTANIIRVKVVNPVEKLYHKCDEEEAYPGEELFPPTATPSSCLDSQLDTPEEEEDSTFEIKVEDHGETNQINIYQVALNLNQHENFMELTEEIKHHVTKNTIQCPSNEGDLRLILTSDPSFRIEYDNLLGLQNHRVLDASNLQAGKSNVKLIVDCLNDLLERKHHQMANRNNPMLLSLIWSPEASITISSLSEELQNDIERLQGDREFQCSGPPNDILGNMIRRDLTWKSKVISSNWDVGWNTGLAIEEAELLVTELVDHVLNELTFEIMENSSP